MIVESVVKRIRPKPMTVLTMMLGLVPVLWSTGARAEVMNRIAAPMVGGLATSFLLELSGILRSLRSGNAAGMDSRRPPHVRRLQLQLTRNPQHEDSIRHTRIRSCNSSCVR